MHENQVQPQNEGQGYNNEVSESFRQILHLDPEDESEVLFLYNNLVTLYCRI